MSKFHNEKMNAKMNKKVWAAIKDIKTGMLVTSGARGLRTKPMYLVQDDYKGIVHFFTNINSNSILDVKDAEQTCVTFTSPKDGKFISLYGTARVNTDSKLMKKFWNPMVAAWYPEGMKNAVLIDIIVTHGEFWENNESKLTFAYETLKANILKVEPELGEYTVFN